MDKLEKFIIENREAFDSESPKSNLWEKIEGRIPQKKAKRISLLRYVRVAAAVIGLLFVGAWMGTYFQPQQSAGPMASMELPVEFDEMQEYYKDQINDKIAKLASYDESHIVKEDLLSLDTIFSELQMELKEMPKGSEEMVVSAIIKNYQTKIEILEKVLDQIELKKNKSKKDEKISI